jgi:hypothetical protein
VSVPDHYAVLGLRRDASDVVIKAAYRALAKDWHPDTSMHQDADEHFKKISEAWETLGDRKRRDEYDRKLDAEPGSGGDSVDEPFDDSEPDDTSTDETYEESEAFNVRVEPQTIDFGNLRIDGPNAEAEFVLYWDGGSPSIRPRQLRSDWWEIHDIDPQPRLGKVTFPLRAEAYGGLPYGRHASCVDIIVDGVVHRVKLVMTVVTTPSERPRYSPDPDGYYSPPHTSPRTRKPPSSPPPTRDPADIGSPTPSRKRRTIYLWALVITVAALLVGIIVAINRHDAAQNAAQQRAAMIVCDNVFTVTDFVQVVMRPPSNTFYWGTPTYSANECEYELTWGPNLETDVQITVACGGDAQSNWNQFKSQYRGTTTMSGFPRAIESTDSTEAAALTPKDQFVEAYLQAISNPDIQMNPLVSHEGAVLKAILRRAYNNETQNNVC